MKINSPAFENDQLIPSQHTCDGENISPPLVISGVPEKAKSLVLIVDDPDAPTGTWDHWLLWNIDPTTVIVEEDTIPEGAIQGTNGFSEQSYGGPCPPEDTHRYFFKLYALDSELLLEETATSQEIEKVMEGHILDQAELIGIYQRQAEKKTVNEDGEEIASGG